MAEEKKVTEQKEERGTMDHPKVLWKYTVVAKDVGQKKPLYDFEGLPLSGKEGDTPSIDLPNIANDIIDLGKRLEHQIIVEEATVKTYQMLMQQLQNAAEESAKAAATETKKD